MRLFLSLLLCIAAVSPPQAFAQIPQSQQQISLSFAPVVKKAAPAVVNIYTKTRVQVRQPMSPLMNDPVFRQFFGQNFAMPGRTREQVVSSLGSGVLVKADGTIVTSHHVIKDAQEITVVLSDKREFEAKVTTRDPQSDLAFLRITAPQPLPYLELRDSDTIEVGELVLAIGNPFGVGQTVTQGIVSALARGARGVSDYQFFIQTDAAINPGNSGGALVDTEGRLIGVNTAIYSTSGGSNGIGFAIPANMVRALLGGKTEGGRVVRPWLGVSVQPVTSEIAESMGLSESGGVIIRKILPGSPAEKSGLKIGDVILAVDGAAVGSEQEMKYRTALKPLGDKSAFGIVRQGKPETLSILMEAPPEIPKRDERTLKGNHPLAGTMVANLSPALAAELDAEEDSGVIVLKAPGGRGGGLALAAGDIVLEINGKKITSALEMEALMVLSNTREWKIVYRRGGRTVSLSVRM